MAEFRDLIGKTLVAVRGATVGSDSVEFDTADGATFALFHIQDCCESVEVVEVHGDPADLAGAVVALAQEASNSEIDPPQYAESFTWTFYRLATDKGPLVLRWLGRSNGYYSERVEFRCVKEAQ